MTLCTCNANCSETIAALEARIKELENQVPEQIICGHATEALEEAAKQFEQPEHRHYMFSGLSVAGALRALKGKP